MKAEGGGLNERVDTVPAGIMYVRMYDVYMYTHMHIC